MERSLHIISPDIPYPADEGRFLDIFYKIRSLHREGIQIKLHCFQNERPKEHEELSKYVKELYYYPIGNGHKGFSLSIPYNVASRYSEELKENLLKDRDPIMLEGVQAAYITRDERFKDRRMAIRITQLEHQFYEQSSAVSLSLVKKFMYSHEACLFRKFEMSLPKDLLIFNANRNDGEYIGWEFKWKNNRHIPFFLPFQEVNSIEGLGTYCLYHGNLGRPANERAAFFLLEKVFKNSRIPFVITGKNPSRKLIKAAKSSHYSCIVENPSEAELQDMIVRAQVNILPSFIESGTPIKLLNTLFNGKHCVVNEKMVKGTGLEPACHIAANAVSFRRIVEQLFHLPFPPEEIELRKRLLEAEYNNQHNAKSIIQHLW